MENNILLHLFGTKDGSFYTAAIIFVVLGLLFTKLLFYTKRNDKTQKASLSFWLTQNWRDFLLAFIMTYVMIRFTDDIVKQSDKLLGWDISVIEDNLFYYFALGAMFQVITHKLRSYIKKKTEVKS